MNKNKTFWYVELYKMKDPTDDFEELIHFANKWYCMNNENNIMVRILNDYWEGKLGWFTLDDVPKKEEKRREEILRKYEESM